MSTAATFLWADSYFAAFEPGEAIRLPESGLYILARRDEQDRRFALYIGEAEKFSDCLGPSHEKWPLACAMGMNEVHLHFAPKTRMQRLAVERRLRHLLQPPLNEQRAPAPAEKTEQSWQVPCGGLLEAMLGMR
jgi:hypothetical protein